MTLLLAVEPDDLYYTHLQQLIHGWDLIEHLNNVLHGLRHCTVGEEYERVPLARRVRLRSKESLYELRGIGYQVLELAVDGVDSKDSVLADVRVPVLETCAACGDQRLEKFCLLGYFLKEAKRRASDVLVRMLLHEQSLDCLKDII